MSKTPPVRESNIESRLKRKIEDLGGEYYKFVSPQNNGVPDRIIIYRGLIIFVELKRPGESPRERQKFVIRKMRRQGARVAVIDCYEKIDGFVDWLVQTAPEAIPEPPEAPQAGFYKI